jgi:hypothetical protein
MAMTDEQAFLDGWRQGVEAVILAHDELLEVLALAISAERRYVGKRLADHHEARVMASQARCKRLRIGNPGESEALELYRMERAS